MIVMSSVPIAQLSRIAEIFPVPIMTHFVEGLQTLALQMKFIHSAQFLLLTGFYIFLIFSVQNRKSPFQILALGFFCSLAMSALHFQLPSHYVISILLLAWMHPLLDTLFFGGKGWVTWVGLLPMTWGLWVWYCQGEITQSLMVERAFYSLIAWIVSCPAIQGCAKKLLYKIISKSYSFAKS